MLKILDVDHFKEVLQFAEETAVHEDLDKKLDVLETWYDENKEGKTITYLAPFYPRTVQPYSFEFSVHKDGKFKFNGGLVYDPNTFSWGIHT